MGIKQVCLGVCVSLLLGGAVCPAADDQDSIPLEQAVREGKVRIEITSLGGSYGDTILLTIKRTVLQPLRLTLTPGTRFKSSSERIHDMAGAAIKGERMGKSIYRRATEILLADDGSHAYVITAYCLDPDKAAPDPGNSFVLGDPDERVGTILRAANRSSVLPSTIQMAVSGELSDKDMKALLQAKPELRKWLRELKEKGLKAGVVLKRRCPLCKGRKTCQECSDTGTEKENCSFCNKTGKCPGCGGTGRVECFQDDSLRKYWK